MQSAVLSACALTLLMASALVRGFEVLFLLPCWRWFLLDAFFVSLLVTLPGLRDPSVSALFFGGNASSYSKDQQSWSFLQRFCISYFSSLSFVENSSSHSNWERFGWEKSSPQVWNDPRVALKDVFRAYQPLCPTLCLFFFIEVKRRHRIDVKTWLL